MSPEDLASDLADGEPRRAYLLIGSEALLRDEALAALREGVLGDAEPSFDFDRFDPRIGAGALADALRTLPVLAKRRLVVLTLPEGRRAAPAALLDAVTEWAGGDGPADAVLAVVAAKPDRRERWVKAFGKAIVICEAPQRAKEIAAFARAEAGRQQVKLERGVAEALAERIGPQLLLIRQEIAKLALLAGPGEPVGRAHVGAGVALAAEEPIWDLTDAIGEGRRADALVALARLLDAGSPPPVVLGALASHFRRLLRSAAGGAVSGPPFVQRKLGSQAQRYGAPRLRAALGVIHETDLALKGAGALRPDQALERAVIALAG